MFVQDVLASCVVPLDSEDSEGKKPTHAKVMLLGTKQKGKGIKSYFSFLMKLERGQLSNKATSAST